MAQWRLPPASSCSATPHCCGQYRVGTADLQNQKQLPSRLMSTATSQLSIAKAHQPWCHYQSVEVCCWVAVPGRTFVYASCHVCDRSLLCYRDLAFCRYAELRYPQRAGEQSSLLCKLDWRALQRRNRGSILVHHGHVRQLHTHCQRPSDLLQRQS